MRRLGSVSFAWLIALLLVATPLMTLTPGSVAAQTADGTPVANESPGNELPVDVPTATPSETPTATETVVVPTATDEPSETVGTPDDISPSAEASPTETAAETTTPPPDQTSTATATPTEEPAEVSAAALSDIQITVRCTTLPETVRVLNTGSANIELTSFGTFVDQLGSEPFALDRTLRPGKTAIFQSGQGAQYGTVLTTDELFTDNAYDSDGVSVEMSVGTAVQMCDPQPEQSRPLATLSDLTITLKCTSSPETVRVMNTGTENIALTSIGTFVDFLGTEPFALDRTLRPGKTAIFQSGQGAQYGTVLTTHYLFTNSAYENDGIKVQTSVGTAVKMCDPRPEPELPTGTLSDLSVTLSCDTYAETIRISNNGAGWITIKGFATYLDPIAEEPIAARRVLKPGQTAIFQSGHGAKYGTILTTRYIFTNSAYDKEGVRISTSVGKVYKACPPAPVPPERWIEVNLSAQYLTAWVGNTKVNGTLVSTGKPGFETPTGTYYVLYRYRYDTMAGCIQGECYYVPDVPWTQYFTNYGHALHGAYWHNDFGSTRSHGCVNLPLWFAEWLWNWATYGTRLWIHY
jgi:lipoprotein-anchoring transpeptidase ErfK/SrfK